jgi:8-oxoguanine deaminase
LPERLSLVDFAILELSHPRYFGLHDPLLGPVAEAGSACLRHLIVGGHVVVDNGVIRGLDLEAPRHDAARIVTRVAHHGEHADTATRFATPRG